MTFRSSLYCSNNKDKIYSARFYHDKGSKRISISDNLITTQEVAQERARAELLKHGYEEKNITIKSIYIKGLKLNDIISFRGKNYIVKEILLDYNPPILLQTIKGVRYE